MKHIDWNYCLLNNDLISSLPSHATIFILTIFRQAATCFKKKWNSFKNCYHQTWEFPRQVPCADKGAPRFCLWSAKLWSEMAVVVNCDFWAAVQSPRPLKTHNNTARSVSKLSVQNKSNFMVKPLHWIRTMEKSIRNDKHWQSEPKKCLMMLSK